MIHRARVFFVLALLLAVGILVANFPFGTLIGERATIQAETARLAALRTTDRTLAAEVQALHHPLAIGRIAHEEYGLVTAGQRSIVVLPRAGTSGPSGENPLADNPVPPADLLPSDAILDPGSQPSLPATHEPSFWHRVEGSLEFWHSLF